MKIEIQRKDGLYHMQARNDTGNTIEMDGSPAIGGTNQGFRPMQLLLAAVGGCSTIDIVNILNKQKQLVEDIHITVDGEREPNVEPSLFKDIHVHFTLKGDLSDEKVKRAVELSMGKYCSVAKTLEKTAKITYSYSIEK
jgi:putative redox protein